MALQDFQSGLWTALPAVVESFDATTLTVTAQPTIQGQVRQPDGTWFNTTMPLCTECPVILPGGGSFVLTFPITKGDEGTIIFASRCIDSWWQSGGIQTQAELRMHDLSDGFFLPKCFSLPNVPGSISTTAVELRSLDGKTLVHVETDKIILSLNNGRTVLTVDDSVQKVEITAVGGLWVNGVQVTVP
jgi:hypothetical protein